MPDGSVLTNVTGFVDIDDNQLLESLGTVFDGIEEIGNSLTIGFNPALETIDTFNVLASVSSTFQIVLNGALTSITGFQSLETVGGVTIFNNRLLTSIAGLGNLRTVGGDLILSGLDNLPNLNELTSLETVTGDCTINPPSLLDSAPQNVREACGVASPP